LILAVSSSPLPSLVPFLPTNYIRDATGQEKANTIADVDFTFPLNNTLDLGTPFLVQYNHTTTNVRPIGNPDLGNFEITFGG
jgi:hypothetical protein